MADARATNPLVEQFRRGGVARDLRLMAAQGLLPLAPADLVELWSDLVRDADEGVRGAAAQSLAGLPAQEFLPIAKDRSTSGGVLNWVLRGRPEPELRAAAAPHRLSVRSPVPCTSTRDGSGTDDVSRAVPPIRPTSAG